MAWEVYILRCADASYYVGYTQDVDKRLEAHRCGKCVHTSRWLPVEICYHESLPCKQSALARERQLKKWSRAKKEALIDGNMMELKLLSERRVR